MTLHFDRISKSFAKKQVFNHLSAEIPPGKIVVLLGSNGAGKTALLRCLATLLSPDEGDIRFDGEVLKRGRVDLRRRLMFLTDFPDLLGESPLNGVAVALRLWEAERPGIEERVVRLFERLGILACSQDEGTSLSRGQRYKAALTALLAVDPELWLLDEPFASGMDPQGINVFRDEAVAACGRGRTIVYSTQLVELACGFSDLVGVLNGGRLTLHATEKDLQRDPRRLAALIDDGQGMGLNCDTVPAGDDTYPSVP